MSRRHRDRDPGTIRGRPGQCVYGGGLGVLLVDEDYPGFPGDVRNPSAYDFPIQYAIVPGLTIDELIYGSRRDSYLDAIEQSARSLLRLGVRAIVCECGYFAFFQAELARRLPVPVFTSSLLQVPLAQTIIGSGQVVGILMSGVDGIDMPRLLRCSGIAEGSNYVVGEVMDDGKCPQFHSLWTEAVRPVPPCADFDVAQADFLELAVAFRDAHPSMGAMLLECTGFQPFARALQREIDIPLFSWGTLLEYAYSVVVHRDYHGHV